MKEYESLPLRVAGASDYTCEETYQATRRPLELASTLIPDCYREIDFHDIERERVFAAGWVCVGYTAQVRQPGDVLPAQVAGQPLLIVRDKAGQLRAFYNVCRHRGSLLVDAAGNQSVIRCPYHAWGYALDGRLLGAP